MNLIILLRGQRATCDNWVVSGMFSVLTKVPLSVGYRCLLCRFFEAPRVPSSMSVCV